MPGLAQVMRFARPAGRPGNARSVLGADTAGLQGDEHVTVRRLDFSPGAVYMQKVGRPRLDDSPAFREGLATVLPRLNGKEISQGQAARDLGISVRSLKRYAIQARRLSI